VTGQRDIDEALADLGQAARLVLHAQAALLGHQCSALHISTALTAAEASPGNPSGSTLLASLRDREHYGVGEVAGPKPPPYAVPATWEQDAASPAVERQWCLQPVPREVSRVSYLCSLEKDHDGDHIAGGSEEPGGDPLTWPQDAAGAAEVAGPKPPPYAAPTPTAEVDAAVLAAHAPKGAQ